MPSLERSEALLHGGACLPAPSVARRKLSPRTPDQVQHGEDLLELLHEAVGAAPQPRGLVEARVPGLERSEALLHLDRCAREERRKHQMKPLAKSDLFFSRT